MANKKDRKTDLLKFLLEENNKELVFWRERSWNALKVTVGGYIALAGISAFQKNFYSLSFLVLGIAVLATVYLQKNYKRYQERRDIGARLEMALSLFDKGVFFPDDPLLPEHMKAPKAAKAGSYSFIVAIWVIALATVAAILLNAFFTE